MLLIALVSPLVASKVLLEIRREVKREAHEVLLCLRAYDKRAVLLALALVLLPVSNLAFLGAVDGDEAFATALLHVAGVGAAVVGALARSEASREEAKIADLELALEAPHFAPRTLSPFDVRLGGKQV